VAILIADPDFVDNRIQYMPPLNPFGRKLDTAVPETFFDYRDTALCPFELGLKPSDFFSKLSFAFTGQERERRTPD